ncbi:MAG: DNA polymerase III subunit gamma/tau [Acidobacteriota bacterium]
MTYQVLARKWRPRDFSSLVGQEHVTTALRNALADDRVAQAYLFSGIRGVGKTTAARVLAKALNCGPRRASGATDPCNDCASCRAIDSGSSLDVLEVDAATYSKVEQVRELTETLRYGPASSPYKVVVLDEVHRLSRQAFDALLKIVEEPPEHLVFIFATTEIDAVPATILSRCQEFSFRRVASPTLAAHLRTICNAEGIEVSDRALRLIARAGEGSVRDSVALLDQMATFGGGTIDDGQARLLLGGLDAAIFHHLTSALLGGRVDDVLAQVADIERNGWDPHHVYSQFLGYLRDGLHLAAGAAVDSVDLPPEEAEALAELVRPRGHEPLLQILHLLMRSEATVRRSELGLLALEIAWLRAAELPKVTRIQSLLGEGGHGSTNDPGSRSSDGGSRDRRSSGGRAPASRAGDEPTAHGGRRTTSDAGSDGTVPEREVEAPRPEGPEARDAAPPPAAMAPEGVSEAHDRLLDEPIIPPGAAGRDGDGHEAAAGHDEHSSREAPRLSGGSELLPRFVDLLSARHQSLAALLREARLDVHDGIVDIRPRTDDDFLARTLARSRHRHALDDAVRQIWGESAAWHLDGVAPGPAADPAPPNGRPPSTPPTAERPTEAPGPSHRRTRAVRNENHAPATQTSNGRSSRRAGDADRGLDAELLATTRALPGVGKVLETFPGSKILQVRDLSTDDLSPRG